MNTKTAKNNTAVKSEKKEAPAHIEDIEDYWTKRSQNFSDSIERSIADGSYLYWLNQINEELVPGRKLKVLDCGCGPGFFSIILGREGHFITAVDYSDGMVKMANKNFKKYGVVAKAEKMDAHNLTFPDNSFDLIVSRNIMWTLADPPRVYSEWMRVLRPGGKIVTFDGNYKLYENNEDYRQVWAEKKKKEQQAYRYDRSLGPSLEDFEKMDAITGKEFMVAHCVRPVWDMEILLALGAMNVSSRVEGVHGASIEKDGVKKYLPMTFKVTASKGDPDVKWDEGRYWN